MTNRNPFRVKSSIHVMNTRDVITFQGKSVAKLKRLFEIPSMISWHFATSGAKSRANRFMNVLIVRLQCATCLVLAGHSPEWLTVINYYIHIYYNIIDQSN